MGAGKNSPT